MSNRKPRVGYHVTALVTVLVVLARAAFERFGGPDPTLLILFLLPVAVAGWLGGLRCGLFATALNALLAVVLFTEPAHNSGPSRLADRMRVGVYGVVGVTISVLYHLHQRVRSQVGDHVRHAHARQREAEHAGAGRAHPEQALSDASGKLSGSELPLRQLLEGLPQLVWTCTPDGGCDYLSRQWVEYTGVPETEQLGDGWTAVIHPDDLPRLRTRWGQSVRDRTPFDIEFRIRGASGEWRWFKTRAVSVTVADGGGKWFGTCTDIHDRKAAEEELRQANETLEGRVAERTADLRASEERFRLAAAAAGVGVWEWNLRTNQIHWNARMFALYHVAPTPDGVVPYEAWSGAVLPEDLTGQVEALRATIDCLGAGARSFRIRLPDGRCRHIEAAEQVRANPDGRAEWVVGTNLDVTDRVAAESALRASEQRFRAVFHTQFQFIGLMSPDGVLLEANRTALAAAGVKEADVLGRPFWETAWWAHDPAQQDRLREAVRRAAGGRQDRFEASHPRADGTLMWVDFSLTPYAEDGRVVFLIPEGRDITGRKRAEDALRVSEERFRAFLDHMPLAAWATDEAGRLAVVNRHLGRMLAREQADLLGRTRFDLLAPADAAAHESNDRAVRASGRAAEMEEDYARPDGTRGSFLSVKFPVRGADGASLVGGVAMDITERKQAERALAAQEDLLRRFITESPVAVAMFDRDMRYLHASGRWLADHGLAGRAVTGASHYELFPDIPERWRAMHRRVLAGAVERCDEDTFPVSGGGSEWVEWECRPWHAPGGAVGGVLIFAQVITPRKRAELALRESEELLGTFFEAPGSLRGVVELTDGDIVHLRDNAEAAAFFGRAADEMRGRRASELGVPADGIRLWAGHYRESRRLGRPVQFEFAVPGTGRWLRASVSPLAAPAGDRYSYVAWEVTEQRRAEEAVRASEERFRSAFENAPIGIALVAPDGGWLRVNRSLCEIVGYAEADLLGTDSRAIAHPEDSGADREYIRQVLDGTLPTYQIEKRFLHRRGHVVHVLEAVSLVRDGRGGPLHFITQIKDITQRKRDAQELAAQEAMLRQFITHSPAAIAMFDREVRYLHVSNRWVADFRLDRSNLVGRSHYDVFPDLPDRWKAVHRRVLAGAVEACDEDPFERSDGSTEWLQWECRPWRTADGVVGGLVVFIQIVTDRKRAEAALRASEERLRLALQGASAGSWSWDATVGDTRWDDQFHRNYGFAPDQPRGLETWLGGIHPDDRPLVVGRVEAVRATPGDDRWEMEFRSLHPGGGVRWHHGLGRCERDAAGELVRVVGIDLDVTARKQAEQKVRASLREKEVLLKEIHHRVKNNLQIISALLHLQSNSLSDPAVRTVFEECRGRVKSMALIHERLYRSGDLAGVDLAEYVRQLAADLCRAYRVSHESVHLDLDVTAPPLPLDVAIPCGLLLNEMISNCLKHAFAGRPGGTVGVTFRPTAGGRVVLSVSDDGPGFPPGFDFRAATSFGLQLVHTLAEQLSGHADLPTGPGATVAVTFPAPGEMFR